MTANVKDSTQPIVSDGTLIVVMAADNGVVLASDSRLSVENAFCDGVDKFVEPAQPDRTIIFVTGRRGFYPPEIQQAADVCSYVRSVSREFDFGEIARLYLETAGVGIDDLPLDLVGGHCVEKLYDYLHHSRYFLRYQPNEVLSALGFVAYDPARQLVIIRSIQLVFDSNVQLLCRVELDERVGLDDVADPRGFGETEYFGSHVLPTFMDEPLRDSTRKYWPDLPKVRHMPLGAAVDIATDIIEATSRMTERRPASSGIGGPVDVRIMGGDARPTKYKTVR